MTKKNTIEIVGWYGAIAILLAYALVSFEVIKSGELLYQLLNFTGALGIVVVSLSKGVGQSAVLNIFWAVIAIIAIFQIILN